MQAFKQISIETG